MLQCTCSYHNFILSISNFKKNCHVQNTLDNPALASPTDRRVVLETCASSSSSAPQPTADATGFSASPWTLSASSAVGLPRDKPPSYSNGHCWIERVASESSSPGAQRKLRVALHHPRITLIALSLTQFITRSRIIPFFIKLFSSFTFRK